MDTHSYQTDGTCESEEGFMERIEAQFTMYRKGGHMSGQPIYSGVATPTRGK